MSKNRNFKSLLVFSLGLADGNDTMAALGLDSQEDLFLLMVQAHLPMPRLPQPTTQAMVDSGLFLILLEQKAWLESACTGAGKILVDVLVCIKAYGPVGASD